MRRDLASALRTRTHDLAPPPPGRTAPADRARPGRRTPSREIEELRATLKAHPCHACPDREEHARWAERWFKLERDAATLKRRVEQRTNTVARQFDRVCEVLTALGYLEGEGTDVKVTEQGRHLMRLYSELDLVAAESLRPRAVGRPLRARAGRGALGAGLRGPAARRRLRAADARRPGPRGDRGDGEALGPSSTRSSASTTSTSCASPTSASPGRPTAGPRATSSTTC